MFDDMTTEERNAWRRKVRAVDAALRTIQTEPEPKPDRRPQLIRNLAALHLTQARKTAIA